MATRTNTELKVFLDSATDSYDKYGNLTDKSGTVFFDRNRRAVYAEGVLITSDVVDVKMTGSKLMVKKVGESTYTELADLAIPNVFVKFTENQGLTIAEQRFARANIGVKDAVDNLESTDTIAPLSANQGKVLNEGKVDKIDGKGLSTNDYTDGDRNKLAGIEQGAQANRHITVNDSIIGTDANSSSINITGNLIRVHDSENGLLEIGLYGTYDSGQKKIFFRTDDTTDAVDLFEIDATDFIKDSFVKAGSYDSDKQALILTLVTGKDDSGNDITEEVGIPVGALIDEYIAGDGIDVTNNVISAKLGNGLQFDNTADNKKITLKTPTISGLNVTTTGVAVNCGYGLDIDDNNEIFVDIDTDNGLKWTHEGKFGVDFTKAPVQSVNGQTGVVNIDVTPKVWQF